MIITDHGTSGDLWPVNASTKRKEQTPAQHSMFRKKKPCEFLHSLQIRLDHNILVTCAVVGAERLIHVSRQIYRSVYSYLKE